jgi:hypothetical protein
VLLGFASVVNVARPAVVHDVLVMRIRFLWMLVVEPLEWAAHRGRLTKRRQAQSKKQHCDSDHVIDFHNSFQFPRVLLERGTARVTGACLGIPTAIEGVSIARSGSDCLPETIG